jgi:uncharacterized repeat protein (TIGR01451 family)
MRRRPPVTPAPARGERRARAWMAVAAVVAVAVALGLGAASSAQAAAPTPPFNQCPAAGSDTSCELLIWIDPTGHIQILSDATQPPFDGADGDDVLVGIQNDSATTVNSVTVGGFDDDGEGLFDFDDDGACSTESPPVPVDCPAAGATGYEGATTTFSAISDDASTGTIDITGGLAPGAGAWLSLEGFPTAAQILINPPAVDITTPDGDFVPVNGVLDADYTCTPGVGAVLQSCIGTVPNGAPLDTSTQGDHALSVSATDTDGVSVTKSTDYYVFAPVTATITTPSDGATYTHGQSVSAAYSCATDPDFNVASCAGDVPNGSPIDTSTAGSFTFTVNAADDAGQTATATSHYQVLAAPPTATVTTPADGASYAQNQPLTASFACAPGAGGGVLASCVGPVANGSAIDTSTTGTFTFKVTATDTDTQATSQTVTYKIVGRPTATITTPANNATYVHNQTVSASFSCTAGAGGGVLQSCVGQQANGSAIDTSSAGTFTFKVTATDTDTQTGSQTVTYKVLAAPPTATITTPANNATYTHNQTVSASFACTPGAGGGVLASCVGPVANGSPIDTSTVGTHAFKVTATDTDTQTGSATSTYSVIPAANLSLTKTSAPNPVIAGQQLTYTLTAHNAGPDDAVSPKIVDTLPAGAVFQKEGAGAGSTSCTAAGQTVTCLPSATIPAGQDATVMILVLPASGPVVNTATVSSATADPDLSNNTATNTNTAASSCTQTISTRMTGQLEAASGQFLCVTGTTVTGSIDVDPGGALTLTGSTLTGSITSASAQFITICGSHVNSGPVVINNTALLVRVGDDDSGCAPNTTGGAVKVDSGRGGVEVYGNTIGGSLTLTNNLGASPIADGIPEAEGNHITGSLTCTGNSPAPVDDGNSNTVGGAKHGQCVNL